jgi:hypothetical protein
MEDPYTKQPRRIDEETPSFVHERFVVVTASGHQLAQVECYDFDTAHAQNERFPGQCSEA